MSAGNTTAVNGRSLFCRSKTLISGLKSWFFLAGTHVSILTYRVPYHELCVQKICLRVLNLGMDCYFDLLFVTQDYIYHNNHGFFLYQMVAHFTMRTHGENQAFRFFKGIRLHRKIVVLSDFFLRKDLVFIILAQR